MKPLKRLERYVSAVFSMGRIKGLAKEAQRGLVAVQPRVDELEERSAVIERRLQETDQALEHADAAGTARMEQMERTGEMTQASLKKLSLWQAHHDGFADRLVQDYRRESATLRRLAQADTAMLSRMFSALSARLDGLGSNQGNPAPVLSRRADPDAPALPTTAGFDLFKDRFHQLLNSRAQTQESPSHLGAYLPDVEEAWQRTNNLPVMDLGCGRGAWLTLLAQRDIPCFGVDTDATQIAFAKEANLDVRQENALVALAAQKDASLSVITAHHLMAYLPFDAVVWSVREAMRVLAPGGLLILETPDVRNLRVAQDVLAAQAVLTNPAPLRMLSKEVFEALFETAGFDPVDTHALNPHANFGAFLSKPGGSDELVSMIFGSQDLAVLGTKPRDP